MILRFYRCPALLSRVFIVGTRYIVSLPGASRLWAALVSHSLPPAEHQADQQARQRASARRLAPLRLTWRDVCAMAVGVAQAIRAADRALLEPGRLLDLPAARDALLSARIVGHRHSILGRLDLRAVGLRVDL